MQWNGKKLRLPTVSGIRDFARRLLPVTTWLPSYLVRDFLPGDLVAGLTVGILVIPQGLAYAKLAGLPLQHGLYSSCVGLFVYWLFATSRDVTIGPTAVVSQLAGQVLVSYGNAATVEDAIVFSCAVAFVAGCIELSIGLLQLGIIVDLVSSPVIAGFTSGAALTIICTQLPSVLGIPGINTTLPAYQVLGSTLSNIRLSTCDAAVGLCCVAFLTGWIEGSKYLARRGYRWGTLVGQAGNSIALLLFTLIAYGVNLQKSGTIKVVGSIPAGFNYARMPNLSAINNIFPAAFTVVLVSIMEHIAVTKSFGRVNGYKVNANQEIIALGFTNIIGSFIGGFAATGSFSRSAVKSRSGVKSPLSGPISGVVLLIAIFFLTQVFSYIPSAALAGIIVFAIKDLISSYSVVKGLYEYQFTDFVSFGVACIVTFFTSIEIGIFSSVAFSILVLLYRVARPKLQVLGRHEELQWIGEEEAKGVSTPLGEFPGICVFRIEESLSYPNANYVSAFTKSHITANYAREEHPVSARERLWCETGARSLAPNANAKLHGVILDFSAVNGIDSTGLQCLLDIRKDVDLYAGESTRLLFAHVRPRLVQAIHTYHRITNPNHQVIPAIANQSAIMADLEADTILRSGKDSMHLGDGCSICFRSIDEAVKEIYLKVGEDSV